MQEADPDAPRPGWRRRFDALDLRIVRLMNRHGHRLHRWSIAVLFIWYGSLKLWGHPTATELLAHTIWIGQPLAMVKVLATWEVAIGLCLLWRPLVRVAVPLLLLRLPGIVLAFVIFPERCWIQFPVAPTLEGQYLLKDFAIFLATLAIAAHVRERNTTDRRH